MAHKNVLIVDDVAELGRMLQAALATLSDNLVVRVVPSAEEGLLEATRNPVDLVISDIRLPGISGLDFTRRIRLRHKAAKVIQISGMDDASLRQQSIDAGADLFFRKPLAMGEFLDAVERLLELKKTAPLNAPVQPDTTPVKTVEAAPTVVLPDRLKEQVSQLRQVLNAPAAGIIDEMGHILVQEGGPEELLGNAGILPAVMVALSAGSNVPLTLGQAETEMVMAFRGAVIDLMAVSLNASMALILVFKHGPTRVATAIAFDEVTRARLNILGLLREKGALTAVRKAGGKPGVTESPNRAETIHFHVGPAEPVIHQNEQPPEAGEPEFPPIDPVVVPDVAADQKLASDLSAQEEVQKKQVEDVDDFWATAVDRQPGTSSVVRPNTLSFEQARKMGLTPPDPDKSK